MKVYSAQQMRYADNTAIERYGIDGLILMENAAIAIENSVVCANAGKRVLAVCGKGNNAGDGFALLRRLRHIGYETAAAFFENENDLKGDCFKNYTAAKKLGIEFIDSIEKFEEKKNEFDIIIDALYGFGFHGSLNERDRKIVDIINSSNAYIISVDIPSGLEADSGNADSTVLADETVTFTGYKKAHLQFPASSFCGKVSVCDIGIPDFILKEYGIANIIDENFVKENIIKRKKNAHKGSCGKVFAIGGSSGMSGAVCMSAHSALKSGAGLVTAGVPNGINPVFEQKVTEAMSIALEEKDGAISYSDCDRIIDFAKKCDAVVIGPGMGRNEDCFNILKRCLSELETNIVIDADALYALSKDVAMLDRTKSDVIITPHYGEMSRLVGESVQYVESNSIDCAANFAKLHNVTVVLKGAYTVVAGKNIYVNAYTGNSGMASGGSGDVLSGIIGALVCNNESEKAAACGVYIHALAGDKAREKYGEYSMTAIDIDECLPEAFKAFGL